MTVCRFPAVITQCVKTCPTISSVSVNRALQVGVNIGRCTRSLQKEGRKYYIYRYTQHTLFMVIWHQINIIFTDLCCKIHKGKNIKSYFLLIPKPFVD